MDISFTIVFKELLIIKWEHEYSENYIHISLKFMNILNEKYITINKFTIMWFMFRLFLSKLYW